MFRPKGFALAISAILSGAVCTGPSQRLDSNGVPGTPNWLHEKPIVVAGNWDTAPIFRIRKGGNPLWHQADYAREHSEEAVRKLKDLGITLAIIHFFKGFGLEAEAEQLEDARILARLCKENGIRVGVYVGSTIAYETFLLEEPGAADWFLPDYLGEPVSYGGTQTFRKRVYFKHPGYIEYMKKVLKIAVEDLDADLIHFDNTSLRARRPAFHHRLAKAHFRDYLLTRLTPDERRRRLGFEDVTYVEPPVFEAPLRIIDDPLFQLWTDFRCQQLSSFYAEMRAYIRSLDPEVAVENNPHSGASGVNTMWEQGIDYPRLLQNTEFVWTEEGNEAGVTKDGILMSKIRTYKQANALDNRVFTFTGDGLIQMAEALAFNRGCLGMVGGMLAGYEGEEDRPNFDFDNPYTWGGEEPGFNLTPEKRRYVSFLHEHYLSYREARSLAEVAVLHSFATLAFSNGRPYQSTYLFEQTLIQSGIPFDIIFDENLEDLSRYRVLVLADQEALSDHQLELIRRFVAAGGGLVATEHTSLYDSWRRRRPDFGLQDLLEVVPPRWQARASRPEPVLDSPLVRKLHGKGRVVYVPAVNPAVTRPWEEPMTSRYWRLPVNWKDLADSVRWAAAEPLRLTIDGPLTVVADLQQKSDSNDLVLHLINYAAETQRNVDVSATIRLPDSAVIRRLRLLSPDFEGVREIDFQMDGLFVSFDVEALQFYALVDVDLE